MKCKHDNLQVIEYDEQALFQVLYCCKHDAYIDGFGNSLELETRELIAQ